MRDAFIQSLAKEAEQNPNLVLITGDLGYGVLDKFSQDFPNQFINAGINEQTMMGMAAGYASTGKKVFVYSIGNFSTLRCLEQIRNDVCLMNNPVVVVSVGAGYSYGSQGYSHHALEDIAIMRALPNMEVVVPADPIETDHITRYLTTSSKPAYLRLGKSNEAIYHESNFDFKPGKINELQSGNEGTILFSGSVGGIALEASRQLCRAGTTVAVASVPFISSLDRDYLELASSKGPIVVVEEHSKRGGLSSAILEFASDENLTIKIGMIASEQNDLSLIGDQNYLREVNGISAETVIKRFKAFAAVQD